MNKIAKVLYNILHNTFLWVLIAICVLILNSYIFYRTKYKEDYSISYASQRLTITLQEDNYIEVFRLHDYWITESERVVQLADERDKFEANYQENNLNGSITEVYERVEGNNAVIESYLVREDEGDLKLVRKIDADSTSSFGEVDRLYMQFVLSGSEYSFDGEEKLLHAGKCRLKFEVDNNIQFKYQEQDKVLTVYQEPSSTTIQSGAYTFNFDIDVNCE